MASQAQTRDRSLLQSGSSHLLLEGGLHTHARDARPVLPKLTLSSPTGSLRDLLRPALLLQLDAEVWKPGTTSVRRGVSILVPLVTTLLADTLACPVPLSWIAPEPVFVLTTKRPILAVAEISHCCK